MIRFPSSILDMGVKFVQVLVPWLTSGLLCTLKVQIDSELVLMHVSMLSRCSGQVLISYKRCWSHLVPFGNSKASISPLKLVLSTGFTLCATDFVCVPMLDAGSVLQGEVSPIT